MQSYAQDVKNELARFLDAEREAQLAEFVALLAVGSKKISGRLEFSSSNAAVARKVITLAKKLFPTAKPEVAAIRRKKLYKDLSYIVRIFLTNELKNFLDTLDESELLRRARYKVAYLRGAFLAKGTVNRPEGQYFLEISTRTEAASKFVRKQLEYLEFNAGFYQRRKFFVVWLREADSICDFLGMVGAANAVERFEIARNVKEVRLQAHRIVNFETAAINRAIEAAQRQLADIKILIDKKVPVNKKLREVMTLRLENPSSSIGELLEKIPLSRTGLVCRFKKIHELAKKFRRKK